MNEKIFKKGAAQILLILVIIFVIIDILVIGGGSLAQGSVAGSYSREGTPTEEGIISEDTLIGPIPPSCNGILEKTQEYIGQGIIYSQTNHCGPADTFGPEAVTGLDCSGYASRVYRDAGLFENYNWCLNTVGLAYSSQLIRIAKDIETAKEVAEPGDLILFGLGDPDGPPQHSGASHVVIYAGNDTAYESGGRGGGGGPHFTSTNVWVGRELYGVYRARHCEY